MCVWGGVTLNQEVKLVIYVHQCDKVRHLGQTSDRKMFSLFTILHFYLLSCLTLGVSLQEVPGCEVMSPCHRTYQVPPKFLFFVNALVVWTENCHAEVLSTTSYW